MLAIVLLYSRFKARGNGSVSQYHAQYHAHIVSRGKQCQSWHWKGSLKVDSTHFSSHNGLEETILWLLLFTFGEKQPDNCFAFWWEVVNWFFFKVSFLNFSLLLVSWRSYAFIQKCRIHNSQQEQYWCTYCHFAHPANPFVYLWDGK